MPGAQVRSRPRRIGRPGGAWFLFVGLGLVTIVIGIAFRPPAIDEGPVTGAVEGWGLTDPGHLFVILTLRNQGDDVEVARCTVSASTRHGDMASDHLDEPVAPHSSEAFTASLTFQNDAAEFVESVEVTDC